MTRKLYANGARGRVLHSVAASALMSGAEEALRWRRRERRGGRDRFEEDDGEDVPPQGSRGRASRRSPSPSSRADIAVVFATISTITKSTAIITARMKGLTLPIISVNCGWNCFSDIAFVGAEEFSNIALIALQTGATLSAVFALSR